MVNRLPSQYRPTAQPSRPSPGAEHRRQLLLHNRERIEFALEKVKADGMEDPVVLVLDLQDERAAWLASRAGLPWERIERWRDECRRHESVPTQILAAPRWAVLAVVGPMTPESPRGILEPSPPDTFRVVALAAGGNAFADFPMPPSSRFDQEGTGLGGTP